MAKTWIKMLQTAKGAEHGYDTLTYNEGTVYEVEESLADAFFDMKVAQPHKPGKAGGAGGKGAGFASMNIAQLRKIAADSKVNIKGLSKLEDIITALEAAGVAPPENSGISGAPETK